MHFSCRNCIWTLNKALKELDEAGLAMACPCFVPLASVCMYKCVYECMLHACTHTHVCSYLPKYVVTILHHISGLMASPASLARNSPQWWRGECLRTPGRAGKCTCSHWSSHAKLDIPHSSQCSIYLYIKHPWQGKSKDEAGRKPPSTRAQNIPHLLLPTFRPLILESRTVRKYIRSNHNRTAGSKERLQNHSHGAFWDTSIGRQFNEPNSFLLFIMFFLSCAKIQWIIHVQSIVYIT